MTSQIPDERTVVIITGANSGIGYQTALSLIRSVDKGYTIFIGARSKSKAEEAIFTLKKEKEVKLDLSNLIPLVIDLESDESIKNCYDYVKSKTNIVDVLVNNAGSSFDKIGLEMGLTPRQIFQKTFEINITGTHLLTEIFLPLLIKSKNGKILFITSGSSSLNRTEDLNFSLNKSPSSGWPKKIENDDGIGMMGGFLAYKTSKLGLNMIMREWFRILKNDKNLKVFGINPGTVLTNLGGDKEQLKKWGAKDPSTSGEFIKSVIQGDRDKDVGKIVNPPGAPTGDILPW
ncbi:uncharacterized protein I206_103877 [Kwoniella pini CBS 10737]|uniref:Uncharacterized protein n=1 Tax=Kwoniella pini CBS 10737 TaxID=1296096 RepID=A0A1B9I3A1_9TREE|nr:uncharacterized protein I206_04550 [Kwoniella pini CBS 10737]OCF50019.1 hypothetical protein I206_04550 [Kwoniella pini CBS 10737]